MPLISSEQLERYRASAKQRQIQQQQKQLERQQQGMAVAHQAAEILRREFGATRVRLFGSLLDACRVRAESDVDLAVEGLAEGRYLEAVARVLDLSDFSVDIVQVESANPKILAVIEARGVDL